MPLASNEIRHRAIQFSRNWTAAKSEAAEKQTFWNEWFEVFGLRRATVASFEAPSTNWGPDKLNWGSVNIIVMSSLDTVSGWVRGFAFRHKSFYLRSLH